MPCHFLMLFGHIHSQNEIKYTMDHKYGYKWIDMEMNGWYNMLLELKNYDIGWMLLKEMGCVITINVIGKLYFDGWIWYHGLSFYGWNHVG